MTLRIRIAESILRAGEFLKTIPVAILRYEDMSQWARKRYNRHSIIYNEMNDPDQGLTEDEQILWQEASKYCLQGMATKKKRVLILGGGGGREAIFFASQGWQVTALDISEGMLEQAKEAVRLKGYNLDTIQGDLACFETPVEQFNMVWTSMFLYSLVLGRERRIKMLKRFRKMMTYAGLLVVSFHFDSSTHSSNKAYRLRRLIAKLTFGNHSYQNGDILFGTLEFRHSFTSEKELIEEFNEAGLTVEYLEIIEKGIRGCAVLRPNYEQA